ncbi:MAG: pentapeptide repeat-containing protein [Candidatus Nanopelagicales bacterium]|nr:pentapeptide repeat-containing protein [Candidatus Nanopelagicales bacterium]
MRIKLTGIAALGVGVTLVLGACAAQTDTEQLREASGPPAAAAPTLRDCSKIPKVSGADLSNCDLSKADLSNANLYNENLMGAHMSGANLSGANLSKANLSKANLTDANLTR